ncbi:helix-turn-helix domain-containing protein [Paenibacillus pinihumi]|uniref:helix-turn-helix domain-containing protein n=1 Tax=Paenibacillus pinihumi TaxID=669462 RepID=UPI000420B11C|nr:helix-turn-helix domain-containing protein [Paenibacillus pinihumi]
MTAARPKTAWMSDPAGRSIVRMFGYFANVQMFRKFLLSYILILVMPLIAGFIVYQASIHRIMDYASENGRELLNQAISLVDKKLDDIESFTYQLSLHPEVHGLMLLSSRSDKDFAYNLYKVKNSIYPYWSTYFRNFYLYFNQIDTIVTPEAAYVRPEDYYRGHSYEGVDYEEWNKKINQTYLSRHYFPSMLANTGKRKEAVITYVQSIPPGSTSTPKANVVVMIDQKEIASLMGRISSQYGGSVSVFDNQHQLILSSGTGTDTDTGKSESRYDGTAGWFSSRNQNHDFIYIEANSSANGWTYVAALSKKKLYKDVNYIQTFNFLLSLVTILVGLAIAVLFAYRHSIPLNRLLGIMKFPDLRKPADPYAFLSSNVEEIISSNDRLQNQLQNQLPILQDTVIRKLLFGGLSSSKEAMKQIEQANLPLQGAFGYAGMVKILHPLQAMEKDMMDEMNVAQLMIHNELTAAFFDGVLYCNVDADQVAFLLTCATRFSRQEEQALEENLASLIRRLEEQYSLKVNIGLGRAFDRIEDIPRSYDQAVSALLFDLSLNARPSFYKYKDSLRDENINYYYPIELELRLIHAVTNGESEEVSDMLSTVYRENAENKVLSYQAAQQLLAALQGTILRIVSKTTELSPVVTDGIAGAMEEMMTGKIDLLHGMNQIQERFLAMTRSIHERKFIAGKMVITQMKEWIKHNFHEPDLTLHQLSEAVDLPEKMVPLIFKEHVGVNISDYIEDTRINFAKSMLIRSEATIEDIALQSGYNSAHSFRRAFKRNTGSSPSEFQKMMRNL